MSNLLDHAKRELAALGYKEGEEGPNGWMYGNVIELIGVFAKQGHSGGSAPHCIQLFEKLARFEPLKPLTGEDSEWHDVSEHSGRTTFQNVRCSHVFKDENGTYDIEGKVFVYPDGGAFTNGDSRVTITFPYTPKTEYVQVTEDR